MKKFTILPRSIENANGVEGVKNISMRFELGTSDDTLKILLAFLRRNWILKKTELEVRGNHRPISTNFDSQLNLAILAI